MNSSSNPDSDDHDKGPQAEASTALMPEGILLLNRQRRERANWVEIRDFLRRLASAIPKPAFSVCLVSDEAIRRYNRRFRGVNRATDVLSFPSGERKNGKGAYLGDILISVETARHNARTYGLRLEEEIELLALHGVLHLLGHDHDRDTGEMARLERDWSRRLGLPQSLTGRAGLGAARRNGSRRLGQ
jgi:probable rRNA maturation factor